MYWCLSDRADPRAARLADGHYNRQKPGTPQFVKTGSCLVLLTDRINALWVTSFQQAEYTHHAWAGTWECSYFRNISSVRASDLIREAVAVTRWFYGEPPALGFITFVNETKLRAHPQKHAPGYCYEKAGWTRLEEKTRGGLIVLQLLPADMPEPRMPHGAKAKSIELARYVQRPALIM